MNAMTKAERDQAEEIQDLSAIAPRTAEGRLREWSRARWYASVNPWPPESPMYAVLHSPGRATDGASDGGMVSLMHRGGKMVATQTRVVEVTRAISALPPALRDLIRYMYDVPQRERPKTEKHAAEHFQVSRSEIAQRYGVALGWIARELCIPEIWCLRAGETTTY